MIWDFLHAAAYMMKNEGIDSDHADDRGGRTRFGVSARAYPDVDIGSLTAWGALEIYHRDYWLTPGFDKLSPARIAVKVFDFGVVAGPGRSAKMLQRALNQRGAALGVDGIAGKATRAALSSAVATHGEDSVLAKIAEEQAGYFQRIIDRSPSQEVFAAGWGNRARRLPSLA